MFNQIIDLILALALGTAGGYCLYTAATIGSWTSLQEHFLLYPMGCLPGACLDAAGFMSFMRLRIGLVGLLALPAALMILLPYLARGAAGMGKWGFLLALAAVGLYMLFINRSKKRFWV